MRHLKHTYSSITASFIAILYSFTILISIETSKSKLSQEAWWGDFYTIASPLLSGAIVSFIFFYLVVKIPENRRAKIIKNQFKKSFDNIKRSILKDVISASINGGRYDLQIDHDTVENLMTVWGFEATFKGGERGHEGFYAFRNHMSGDALEYRDILIDLHMLSREIDFLLNNIEMHNEDLFIFFKKLQRYLTRVEKIGPGYNEEKELSNLIWDLYGQFCFIEGNLGYNRIQRAVNEL